MASKGQSTVEAAGGSAYQPQPVSYDAFFGTYHGHTPDALTTVLEIVSQASSSSSTHRRPVIFLAGDSSLDSKYWFPPSARKPACNGHERAVTPAYVRPDVAWAVNHACTTGTTSTGAAASSGTSHSSSGGSTGSPLPFVCINGAVEESTIAARRSTLLPQDVWVRDHIRPEDVLVVSLGGNDIALRPSAATVACIGSLVKLASDEAIEAGTAMGLGHFVGLFKEEVEAYLAKLTAIHKPRLVILCMIYYPHEQPGGSWADSVLGMLGYNTNPARLQLLIRKVYEMATSQVKVQYTTVIPCPLFEVLDSSPASRDYIQRVEPSEGGGVKMAAAFLRLIAAHYDGEAAAKAQQQPTAAEAATAAGAGSRRGSGCRAC